LSGNREKMRRSADFYHAGALLIYGFPHHSGELSMQWIKHLFAATLLSASLLAGAAEPTDAKININTASAAELSQLNGIGKAKAEAIVQFREQQGGFKSVDELTQIKGIGAAIVDKNRARLTLE